MELEFKTEEVFISIKTVKVDAEENPVVDAIYEVNMNLPKIGYIKFKIIGYDDGEVEIEPII